MMPFPYSAAGNIFNKFGEAASVTYNTTSPLVIARNVTKSVIFKCLPVPAHWKIAFKCAHLLGSIGLLVVTGSPLTLSSVTLSIWEVLSDGE